MRFKGNSLLLAGSVAIAMALSAPSASALTVNDESTSTACPALSGSGGGCSLHVNGEVQLQDHVFGVETTSSDCVVELNGRIGGNGTGKVDTVTFSDHGVANDCQRSSCDVPWDVTLTSSGGVPYMTSGFCASDGANKQSCKVTLAVQESGHTYTSVFHVGSINVEGCEAEGQFAVEGGTIELANV
jgi:hypothetical protein